MIKMNKWTLGLAAVGLVTIPATMQAQEKLSSVQTALSSTTISGYVDTSAQWQAASPSRAPGYAFNTPSKQDGLNLNVVNLTIEKPLDEKDNWAAGYKIESIYGPNAVGYNNAFGTSASGSDFGLKQAYVALRAPVGNGLDFKMGTFDSILGYEVYNAGANPNYTRSWGYSAEPTQMTGLLTSYQITREIGIAGGVADTASPGINNRSYLGQYVTYPPNAGDSLTYSKKSPSSLTYMGAVTLTAPESMGFLKGSTLYGAIVNGFDTSTGSGIGPSTSMGFGDSKTWFYAGMTLNTPVTGLRVGLAYDYVGGHGSYNGGTQTGPTTWFNAGSVYASYQATTHLSFHARGEYMWMDRGSADFLNATQELSAAATGSAPGLAYASSIVAMTGTVQYDLWANVITRLEFRWDHAADGSSPFNAGNANNFLLALNVIYKF